jgi:acetolactate synthase-1/2/3 large subunit
VAEAFSQMTSGRPRPVALEVPMDVLARRAWVGEPSVGNASPAPEPDPQALERAAVLLNGAEKPMIFVGGGAQSASAPVRELARRLDAPVVAGWMGQGVMDGRAPLSINLPAAHRLWPEVDVALAVGCRFLRQQTDWGLDDGVKVIRIDLDPTEITRHARPEVGLLADAGETLEALLPQIETSARPAWRARIATARDEVAARIRRELAPQVALIDAIREALPKDGIVVEDLTQINYVSRIAFPVHGPRQYLTSGYQGTLGAGYPTALGAKVACPDQAVVAVCGDGGFMYNVQELATAVQHGINVVAVVFDDGAYGNVRRMQRQLYGNRIIASDLRNPDFVPLAQSFGMAAQQISGPDHLAEALAVALARDEPALLSVKVGEMPDPWPHIMLPKVRG